MKEQDTNPRSQTAGRPTLSGRWLVLLTLSLFLVVPVVAFLAWQMTQGTPQRIKLNYDQRATWFMQPVTPRPLKYNTFVAGETGKQYKKTDLQIDPEVEQVLQRCVRLAQSKDFRDEKVRDDLTPLAEQPDYGFYPAYLLASWYAIHTQPEEYDRWMRVAFDRAGGALVQQFIDEAQQPVAGYILPPIAIGYDRVVKGQRDATLVLVYPYPISETNGYVYLPTFRSIYRLTDPALPIGADPGLHPIRLTLLPQPAEGREPNWFAVPDGAVGLFGKVVLTPAEIQSSQ